MITTIITINTAMIALVTVYIAYQQYKTNKDKLRLELFNKRFSVYNGFRSALDEIQISPKFSHDGFKNFYSKTSGGDFLFGDDITNYREVFVKKMIHFNVVNGRLFGKHPNIPIGDKRNKLATERGELENWFSEQYDELKVIFNRYIKFEVALKEDVFMKIHRKIAKEWLFFFGGLVLSAVIIPSVIILFSGCNNCPWYEIWQEIFWKNNFVAVVFLLLPYTVVQLVRITIWSIISLKSKRS
ncbi:MAG: hypothetical protein AAB575_05520 [Patescibacteria group bacterium]